MYILMEVCVVGCGVISADDAGQSVFFAEDAGSGGVGSAVNVEVIEQAVGQQIRFPVFQSDFFGDGGLADVAVVVGTPPVQDDGVADDDAHGVAERKDVVVCVIQIGAVAVAHHIVMGELHVPDEPVSACQYLFVIVAHVRPIENLAVFLTMQVADAQYDGSGYDENALHVISIAWSRFCR